MGLAGLEGSLGQLKHRVIGPSDHLVIGHRAEISTGQWKYVTVRRWFFSVERSIDRGTQRAVFEPNR
jgi:hypothetical protein